MEIPIRSTPTIGKREVRRQSRCVRAVNNQAPEKNPWSFIIATDASFFSVYGIICRI
jgi:hypothetical protein